MSLPWSSKSVYKRFKYTSMLRQCSATEFLHLTGLRSTDAQWSFLRNEFRQTALHYVADRLRRYIDLRDSRSMNVVRLDSDGLIEQWRCLEVDLMTTGLDANAIGTNGRTAFMDLLYSSLPYEARPCPSTYRCLDYSAQLWRGMVELAGMDVSKYLQHENVAMGFSKTKVDLFKAAQFACVDNSSQTSVWTVKVLETTPIYLWQKVQLPGAFCYEPEPLPELSLHHRWYGLDHRTLIRSVKTKPALVDTRQRSLQRHDAMIDLIEATQDDAGIVPLLIGRYTDRRASGRRSHSSPPLMHRSKRAYYEAKRSPCHIWLPTYHLCPRDAQYRCGCIPDCDDHHLKTPFDITRCVHEDRRPKALHESFRSRDNSFFTEVIRCHAGIVSLNERISDPALHHTFNADCPQGCGRIRPGDLSLQHKLPDEWER